MKNFYTALTTLFLFFNSHELRPQNFTTQAPVQTSKTTREKSASIVGWIATGITITGALPNAITALRNPIEAKNRYHILVQGPVILIVASWMTFGLLSRLPQVWLPNIFCAFSTIVPWIYVRYKNKHQAPMTQTV